MICPVCDGTKELAVGFDDIIPCPDCVEPEEAPKEESPTSAIPRPSNTLMTRNAIEHIGKYLGSIAGGQEGGVEAIVAYKYLHEALDKQQGYLADVLQTGWMEGRQGH